MFTSYLSTTGIKEITRYLSENFAFCATNSSQKTAFMARPPIPAFSSDRTNAPPVLSSPLPLARSACIFCKGGTGRNVLCGSPASRVSWEFESWSARNCTCSGARHFPSPGPLDAARQRCALCCARWEPQLCVLAAAPLRPELPPTGREVSLLPEQLVKHLG